MPSRSRKSSSATTCCNRQARAFRLALTDPGSGGIGNRRAWRCAAAAPCGGFTLLEVVIALAILGIGLGVILPGIGLSLRLRQDASDGSRLALAAEQVLGDLVLRKLAPERAEEGEIDGCSWLIEPLEAAAAGPAAPASRRGAELVPVRLSVSLPGGARWEFTTLLPRGKAEGTP